MLFAGIDIGSATSKCVLLQGGEVAGSALVHMGVGTGGPERAYAAALEAAGAGAGDVAFCVATGYGRAAWKGADQTVSELTAHALGSRRIFPEVRTVIDIGGQDAKVIELDANGRMVSFAMNDKCAAGTGRFLEVMANVLRVPIGELEALVAQAEKAAPISSTCTVFAESEVISQLAAGTSVPDVVAGICASVASRVAALARRAGVREPVCMSGGVARNGGVRRALEQALDVSIVWSPQSQLAGALGAALYARQKAEQTLREER